MDGVGVTKISFFRIFFQAEDGIRDGTVTGVQTCALPICRPETCLFSTIQAMAPPASAWLEYFFLPAHCSFRSRRSLSPFSLILFVRKFSNRLRFFRKDRNQK